MTVALHPPRPKADQALRIGRVVMDADTGLRDRHAALSAGREIGLADYLRDRRSCPAADDLPPWPGDWAALFARPPLGPGPYRTQGQPEGQP